MYHVYILKSLKDSSRIYIGRTTDIQKRLNEHNQGQSSYTKSFLPWELQTYIVFRDKQSAINFEKYLKSGSGFAFLKKRFLPSG